MKKLLLVLFFFLLGITGPRGVSAQTPPSSCSFLISNLLASVNNGSTPSFTCTSGQSREECFDSYYDYAVVSRNSICSTIPADTLSLDYSLYQQLRDAFIQNPALGATPTPPPINTPPPADTVPIDSPPNDSLLNAFDDQMNRNACDTGDNNICCLGGVPLDGQPPADFTDDRLATKNNFFTDFFASIKERYNSIFGKAAQSQVEFTSNLSTDLCRSADKVGSEYIDRKPMLYQSDRKLTEADETLILLASKWIMDVRDIEPNLRSEAWNDVRQKFADNNLSCTCEAPETYASVSVLGAQSDEVLGVADDVNPTTYPIRGSLDSISDSMVPYCQREQNDLIGMQERFHTTDLDHCVDIMADSYLKALNLCKPIKSVPNYDQEEYNNCFDCLVDEDGTWTALGCIYSDFGRTISERIFGLVLSIAGLISFGCILYASFLLQTSAGNPEKTSKAQELMTACISGLIMIIFSVFILRVIGVDILRLPGFSTNTSMTPTPAVISPALAISPTGSALSPTSIVAAIAPISVVTPGAIAPGPGTIVPTLSGGPTPTFTPIPPTPTLVPAVVSGYECSGSDPQPGEVYLYGDANMGGDCIRLTIGEYRTLADVTNSNTTGILDFTGGCKSSASQCISSIKVGADVQIDLYPTYDFRQPPRIVDSSVSQLDTFNDKAWSVIVCPKQGLNRLCSLPNLSPTPTPTITPTLVVQRYDCNGSFPSAGEVMMFGNDDYDGNCAKLTPGYYTLKAVTSEDMDRAPVSSWWGGCVSTADKCISSLRIAAGYQMDLYASIGGQSGTYTGTVSHLGEMNDKATIAVVCAGNGSQRCELP